MPFAVLKSVREVSSEDKVHCASNLLQNEPAKKWKTGKEGEKSAYVILEMDSSHTIKGIDIGNESSAFVEVLVGGPGCARENFKEILITCSFMTPPESKTNSNPNRVRCFQKDALVKDIADQKWSLLKIICTQPFNRTLKYGLSFIKIHVDAPKEVKKTSDTSLVNRSLGGFKLREESPDSESESTASLFSRWKTSKIKEFQATSSVPRNPSAALIKKTNESFIQKKAASPNISKTSVKEETVHLDRNRNSLLFGDDDDDDSSVRENQKKRLEKLGKAIIADQERVKQENSKTKSPKTSKSSKDETKLSNKDKKDEPKKVLPKEKPAKAQQPSTPSSSQRRPSSSPRSGSDNAKKPKLDKLIQYKPFNQLLNGVVLVISGIQNPDRADLRNKALALGAKYKADWDSSSTHLICAFKNTPKYNQVKGFGKIITRSWIEDCYSSKKRLPWRRYALQNTEKAKPESEDEIYDESLKPQDELKKTTISLSRSDSAEKEDITDIYDENEAALSQVISSGSDTEDEIQRVLATKSPKAKPPETRDIFEISTEEEDYISKKNGEAPDKLAFFKNYTFFVSEQLNATEKIKVEQYIETYHGKLTKSIDKANYVIANQRINDVGKFKGQIVKPLWILECNDSELFIPTKRYLVD